MEKIKNLVKNNKLVIAGVFFGAIAGYLYYHFVGCASGTCAITSNPINSTLYFSIVGGLVFSLLKSDKKVSEEKKFN